MFDARATMVGTIKKGEKDFIRRRGGSFTGRGSLSDVGNSIKIARINVLLQTKKSGN